MDGVLKRDLPTVHTHRVKEPSEVVCHINKYLEYTVGISVGTEQSVLLHRTAQCRVWHFFFKKNIGTNAYYMGT